MTYSLAKVQGQQSVGSEDREETNGRTAGRTDRGDCITCCSNAVGNNLTVISYVLNLHSEIRKTLGVVTRELGDGCHQQVDVVTH